MKIKISVSAGKKFESKKFYVVQQGGRDDNVCLWGPYDTEALAEAKLKAFEAPNPRLKAIKRSLGVFSGKECLEEGMVWQ